MYSNTTLDFRSNKGTPTLQNFATCILNFVIKLSRTLTSTQQSRIHTKYAKNNESQFKFIRETQFKRVLPVRSPEGGQNRSKHWSLESGSHVERVPVCDKIGSVVTVLLKYVHLRSACRPIYESH